MPFASAAQRRFMYAKHPKIARRWTREEKAVSKSLVEIRKAGFLPKTVIRSAPAPHMKSWQRAYANAPTPARSYEPDNRLPWED